jgi:hypothetical protein
MKAITLWQPWASAIATGLKHFETRSWGTTYRGQLAIHAARRKIDEAGVELARRHGLAELPLGAVVAVGELEDCIPMSDGLIDAIGEVERDLGDWRIGRWAWKLGKVRVFPDPIAMRGWQGMWNAPPALL